MSALTYCTIREMRYQIRPRVLFLSLLVAAPAFTQEAVTVRVNAAESVGVYKPISGYFGDDEANFTYAKNGAKLVGELGNLTGSKAATRKDPVYIRTHFMLTTGDGSSGYKWGSTNAYTEDASGKPVYDWTIADRIIETYIKAGAK